MSVFFFFLRVEVVLLRAGVRKPPTSSNFTRHRSSASVFFFEVVLPGTPKYENRGTFSVFFNEVLLLNANHPSEWRGSILHAANPFRSLDLSFCLTFWFCLAFSFCLTFCYCLAFSFCLTFSF